MSLKARIRRLEAQVEWLERWGELRKVERALQYRQTVRQVVDQLTANPKAAARLGITDLPRGRPALADAIAAGHAAQADAAQADAAQADAAGPAPPRHPTLPPPEPPPEEPVAAPSPKTEAWTHDPPEHMQIEKVTWRRRGPQDDLDDDEDEEEGYDPLGRS